MSRLIAIKLFVLGTHKKTTQMKQKKYCNKQERKNKPRKKKALNLNENSLTFKMSIMIILTELKLYSV